VCLAHDLDGSYEECPTTMLDFAQRDQRWCQGNLQHVRLLLAEGLHPASRLHFGMGAMSYLASPLWLALLVLTVLAAAFGGDLPTTGGHSRSGLILFVTTMSLLLLPKLWGVIALGRRTPSSLSRVIGRALGSLLIESIVSMLVAPIMMLLHTRFVVSTLSGKKVKWTTQPRDDRGVPLGVALAVHYPHTLFGLAAAGIAWVWAPGLLPWLLPVVVGLLLSVPLAMLLGSVRVGNALARAGLMTIPEETNPPQVLVHQRDALAGTGAKKRAATGASSFFSLIRDPTFYALHVGILRATESDTPIPPRQARELKRLLREGTLAAATADLRRAILNDWRALESLHMLARSHLPRARSALSA
jgi:membrane glycosyltransferase